MASDSPSEVRNAQAQRLAAALDAIEACLDRIAPGDDPDHIVRELAGPVRAFDEAAREAVR